MESNGAPNLIGLQCNPSGNDWDKFSAAGLLHPASSVGSRWSKTGRGEYVRKAKPLFANTNPTMIHDMCPASPSSACRHLLPAEDAGRRRITGTGFANHLRKP